MDRNFLSKLEIIIPPYLNNKLIEHDFYNIIHNMSNPKLTILDELIELYILVNESSSSLSQVVWDCLIDGYLYLQKLNYNYYVRAMTDINDKLSQIDSQFVKNDISYCEILEITSWIEHFIHLLENYPEYKKSIAYCGVCSLYFKH